MTATRLVLITRRFWPLMGGAEIVMARLAQSFQTQGHDVTILTACWHEDWPMQVDHHGVRVVRLPQAATRWRGTWQYIRGLSRWLRSHRSEYDAVLVSMLKHDAFVAVGEGRAGDFPVVLRAEGAGITGDCHFQQTARFGNRIKRRCQQAAAVIAPATAVAKELEEAGYDSGRVKIIPNGVPILDELVSRQEARTSLAAIHCDMELAPNAPLVVFTGRLDAGKGLRELIQAWESIASAIPDARLWLVGEGPLRDELFQRVRDAELVDSVRMPGTFDDVSDILRAATVFVLPSHAEGLSLSLLEAMAHERAVIASSVPGNQQVVTSGENGLLVPPKNPAVLAQVLQAILEQPEQATAYGQAARQHVTQHFSLETMAERHLAAIEASRNA